MLRLLHVSSVALNNTPPLLEWCFSFMEREGWTIFTKYICCSICNVPAAKLIIISIILYIIWGALSSFLLSMVLEMDSRALYMLGKCSATEMPPKKIIRAKKLQCMCLGVTTVCRWGTEKIQSVRWWGPCRCGTAEPRGPYPLEEKLGMLLWEVQWLGGWRRVRKREMAEDVNLGKKVPSQGSIWGRWPMPIASGPVVK